MLLAQVSAQPTGLTRSPAALRSDPPVQKALLSHTATARACSGRRRQQIAAAASRPQTPIEPGLQDDAAPAHDSPQCSGAPAAMPRQMAVAMALSPLAALSLPLVQNQAWIASAQEFGTDLRQRLQDTLSTDAFKRWASSVDDAVTYMDSTFGVVGVDFSYFWDPELWVKFKEAVWWEKPEVFWNELADRIEYRSLIPQAGLVGDMRISYAKFLELLEGDRVKRVVVYGDMRTAIVEVPHPWYASISGAPGTYPFVEDATGNPVSLLVPNPAAPNDPMQWFCPEMPEWNMEKYRFYVDLPGDFWERGTLLRYLRSREVQVEWDAATGQFFMPHTAFTQVSQVRTEVQVLDPAESWDFLSWLTDGPKMAFYEQAAAVCLFFRGLSLVLDWSTGTPIFRLWAKRKKKKKSKEESMWEKLTKSTAREFMTKDAKTGKVRDTQVRFKDIAGLDNLVVEMKEVVKLLLKDPAYMKVGAKVPRGIIFQGPPGTGKTYMARALAGEAGVAFFSSVGSEFVEMFAGVAAARVNNLFSTARKRSPAIIFIDEIDAIGRARSTGGADPGSMERESALLAMLVQMDGINGNLESVLTIGATNLVDELDSALLRPGRFEVVYYLPNPGPVGRLEILRFHARNKKLESDGILTRVAEATQGFSAASLENLMNEAAILTVRRNVPQITLPLIMELVEGGGSGTRANPIPASEAKDRLARITAAKAVALALTPGMQPIRSVTLWSKTKGLGPTVEFWADDKGPNPFGGHAEMVELMNWATNVKTNAATIGDEHLGEFLHVANLLVPLYAPRAAEISLYGPDAASLVTAPALSDCFQIGYWCVRNSQVHPRFKSLPPFHTNIWLGENELGKNQRDPLAVGIDIELGYHKLTLTLLKASWRRAQRLVAQRSSTVERVAQALLSAPDEFLSGEELVALVDSTPPDDVSGLELDNEFLPIVREVMGKVPGVIIDGEAAAPPLEVLGPATAGHAAARPAEPMAAGAGMPSDQPAPGAKTAEGEGSAGGNAGVSAAAASVVRVAPAARVGQVTFQPLGTASFQPAAQRLAAPALGASAVATFRGPGTASFRILPVTPLATSQAGAGAAGAARFRPSPGLTFRSHSRDVTPRAHGAGQPPAATASSGPELAPEIRLSSEDLVAVSKAIMGRLDIVDLIGRNTALETAERVRDALLDPETVRRLKAVRKFVEDPDGTFPPAPAASELPLPLYGHNKASIRAWKQRQRNVVSWSAMEMLFNDRQAKYFAEDADQPSDDQRLPPSGLV